MNDNQDNIVQLPLPKKPLSPKPLAVGLVDITQMLAFLCDQEALRQEREDALATEVLALRNSIQTLIRVLKDNAAGR